jgi:hypothetical protein
MRRAFDMIALAMFVVAVAIWIGEGIEFLSGKV